MFFAHIALFVMLCVITEQTYFNKAGKGVTDITVYSIPESTTNVYFMHNLITFIPANFFTNLS